MAVRTAPLRAFGPVVATLRGDKLPRHASSYMLSPSVKPSRPGFRRLSGLVQAVRMETSVQEEHDMTLLSGHGLKARYILLNEKLID